MDEWFGTTPDQLWMVLVSTVAVFAAALGAIRLFGLRSLSKMSSFDFVVTIALGSIVASVAATSSSLWNGVLAFLGLMTIQWVVATLRRRAGLGWLFDNTPILLMRGGTMIGGNLTEARVTEDDVVAKLREANVTDLGQVLAVVLETTGDISVLHGDGPLDERLLDGVRPLAHREAT